MRIQREWDRKKETKKGRGKERVNRVDFQLILATISVIVLPHRKRHILLIEWESEPGGGKQIDKRKTNDRKMEDGNQKRQLASRSPYGEMFESCPGQQNKDSRQFLQLPALVMFLTLETFKVAVQLPQLQLLFLVTAKKKLNTGWVRESLNWFNHPYVKEKAQSLSVYNINC